LRLGLWLALAALGAFALFLVVATRVGDAEAAAWERAASMSQRRSYIAATQVGDAIYTAGGMVGETGRPLATFSRYLPSDDRWETLTRLPVPTRAAAAAAVGGRVYVLGGTTPDGNTAAVWAWDGERWAARAPLPEPRFNHSALAIGDEIWVFGGYREGRELRDVLVYDSRADRWREGPPLPRPNHAFDVVLFRGEAWLIGGRIDEEVLRDVWILDPETERWREGPAMPRPMELLGAAVAGDEIHAVWESTYQVYDARAGAWRDGPTPRVTRHALAAFVAGRFLYTVGGCTTALRDSPIVERIAVRRR